MGQSSSTQHSSTQHSSPSSRSRTSDERRERDYISQSLNTFSSHSRSNTDGMRDNTGSSDNSTRRPSTPRTSAYRSVGSDDSRQRTRASLDNRGDNFRRHNTARMDQQSTMSRLGTRILPNAVVRGLLNSGEETPAEGRAHRTGLFSRHGPHRFPTFSNMSSRGIARRRSIRGPYPLPRGEATLLPDSSPSLSYPRTSLAEESPESRLSWRRRAGNVRHSIAGPISQIFGQPTPTESHERSITQPRRPSDSAAAAAAPSDYLTPSGTMDTRMDLDEPPEVDFSRPTTRHSRPSSSTGSTSANQGSSGSRRPSGTGRRSGRLLRRDEQTPLSRVLQLAAAAIAAQLSGNTGAAIPNIQPAGSEGAEGSLEHFIQTLRQATSGQNRSPDADGNTPSQTGPGDLPHVNFLRVFRFSNPDNQQQSEPVPEQPEAPHGAQMGSDNDRMEVDGSETGEGGHRDRRLVTLVVVGVRSVPNNSGSSNDNTRGTARLTLESFLRLPILSSNNILRTERGSGGLLRRADGRSRFSPHRHSTGGNSFAANSGSQAQRRWQSSGSRQMDPTTVGDSMTTPPGVLSESPPGPHPPPSTPAEPVLSNTPSGANSPNRRLSSASAVLPQLSEELSGNTNPEDEESSAFPRVRQRRRSDSEAARHRGLGSGAARRNGVVEPDNASPAAGRSWLIYVVGTNISENHPAFAAPSLFTDNPTYEDMILLSSLLGPVKPPVASQEEVEASGGLYRLVEYNGALVAESLSATASLPLSANERCLICLCDYEAGEDVRQLSSCKHMYHRDCIDEWLTTGRNSCPLCRGEGVSNATPPSADETPATFA